MRNLKYLAAYINPILAFVALILGGWWTYGVIVFSFVFVPLSEPFLSSSKDNYTPKEKESLLQNHFFDFLLYFNLVLVYALLFWFGFQLKVDTLSIFEIIGLTISLGIVVSSNGINVAHELGHRSGKVSQLFAKLLLLPAFYTHFTIEHNYGHHLNVGTDKDPASARKNEVLYFFWFRSIIQGYIHAWEIESSKLKNQGKGVFSISNEMIVNSILQLIYFGVVIFALGFISLLFYIAIALIAVLMLESINYVEHYGLRRKMLPSGRYERVESYHSWNANYHLGRIILYELTRHSDHHYISAKKYQVLDHHDQAPELPFGYPTSILIALFPPIWFQVMNKRIPNNA
jgi:alkane 1-monooxygenase